MVMFSNIWPHPTQSGAAVESFHLNEAKLEKNVIKKLVDEVMKEFTEE